MSHAQENNDNTNYDIEQGDSDFINDIEPEGRGGAGGGGFDAEEGDGLRRRLSVEAIR